MFIGKQEYVLILFFLFFLFFFMAIDATNVLAGGQVLVQDPRSLLGKSVTDYIQSAMEYAGNWTKTAHVFTYS